MQALIRCTLSGLGLSGSWHWGQALAAAASTATLRAPGCSCAPDLLRAPSCASSAAQPAAIARS